MSGGKTKHSPAPWEVKTNRHPNTDGSRWGWVEAFPHPAGGAGSPPSGIGNITWSGRQGLANARLIAAAPDLLEALEDLVPLAEAAMRQANRDGAEYDTDAELAAARTAIRAARGEG